MAYYFLGKKKELTPEERGAIAQHAYTMVRWKTYLGFMCRKPINWHNRIDAYESEKFQKRASIPPPEEQQMPDHVKVSTNKVLFDYLRRSYGQEEAMQTSLISNQ